ncbi:MAG: lipase family protein [Fimbriiglobus sp.]
MAVVIGEVVEQVRGNPENSANFRSPRPLQPPRRIKCISSLTFQDIRMPYQLVEDAGGDQRNAAALAAASQFAYFPEAQGAEAFRNELGMTAKLISVNNTQAYVTENDQHIVVAFRGSEGPNSIDGLKDWFMTNALNLLVQPDGPLATEFLGAGVGARWHMGFVRAITDVWEPLYAEVNAKLSAKDRTLWITGHSLGGALTLLASWLLLRKTINIHQIYTFGAPMVGNKVVAAAFDQEFGGKLFRYVNAPDPVPLLPMMSVTSNEFAHCEKLMLLGDESQAANLLHYIKDSAGEAAGMVLSGEVGEKLWESIKGKVVAHLLNDYRQLIG